jgi:hypothetical protein
MRALFDLWIGLAAGAFAARARWPFAPDLVEATDLAPWRDNAARSLGLGLALLLVALRPARLLARPGLGVLLGVLLGAATTLLDPVTGGLAWPWLLVGVAGLVAAHRVRALRSGAGGIVAERPFTRAARGVALALLAAGVAEALTALARLAARTMPDAPPDHAARALAFCALLAVGAFAFGRPFATAERGAGDEAAQRTDHGALVALVVAAFASFASLSVVGGVTTPLGLRALMLRFDLDVTQSGTLLFDVLVSLAAFVLPAFGLGAALHLVRTRTAWVALALGAAFGVLRSADIAPIELFAGGLMTVVSPVDEPVDPGSAGRVLDGLFVAGLGALVAAAFAARGRARVALGAGGLAAIALGLQVQVAPIRVLKAHERFQPAPVEIVEGPSGQFLVDPGGAGLERVSLDQRALVPGVDRARGDRDQLTAALALVPEERRARGARLLFLAPLAPGRAMTLTDLGVARVDRSAGYWRDLASLEAFLARRESNSPFGVTEPDGDARPDSEAGLYGLAGDVVPPDEARRRAARGDYDVIVVPAVEGNRIDARFLAAPADTVQVLWLDARDDAARRVADDHVLLVSSGVEHFVLGRVTGSTPASEPRAGLAPYVPLGARPGAVRSFARLRLVEDERHAANETAFLARFAAGARGTVWADLADGLVLHLGAQRASSPFETAAQRVELDRGALDRLFVHATLGAPDLFTRGLWNGIVDVLRAKRDVPTTYDLVEPLAELWAPWTEGTLALAWADGEELDHTGALERLAPLVPAAPGDRTLVVGYAEALISAQRPAEAAMALATLSALNPADRGLRKALARAQILAKDPAGRALALELLREDPEDRELWGLLGPLAGARPGSLVTPPGAPDASGDPPR